MKVLYLCNQDASLPLPAAGGNEVQPFLVVFEEGSQT